MYSAPIYKYVCEGMYQISIWINYWATKCAIVRSFSVDRIVFAIINNNLIVFLHPPKCGHSFSLSFQIFHLLINLKTFDGLNYNKNFTNSKMFIFKFMWTLKKNVWQNWLITNLIEHLPGGSTSQSIHDFFYEISCVY